MIVCVEGNGQSLPNGLPGFDLIKDPAVAYACGIAFNCSNLDAAEKILKKLLDPSLYVVGHGQNHVFVSVKSDEDWPPRLAMLVDSNDTNVWWSFPALKTWTWP